MHADTLYHRMLAQEKAVEAAKKAGQPLPAFEPVLPVAPATADKDDIQPSEETLKAWKKKLDSLPKGEQAAEEQALRADYRERMKAASELQKFWDGQVEQREARKAEGQATWSDAIMGILGGSATKSSNGSKDGKL
jgi:hypothetical protein